MTGGVQANAENWWKYNGDESEAGIIQQRRNQLLDNLDVMRGTVGTYEYSNLGYMVAGAMAEKLTGKSWENLMRVKLFNPLGMTSAGFGAPGTPGKID